MAEGQTDSNAPATDTGTHLWPGLMQSRLARVEVGQRPGVRVPGRRVKIEMRCCIRLSLKLTLHFAS